MLPQHKGGFFGEVPRIHLGYRILSTKMISKLVLYHHSEMFQKPLLIYWSIKWLHLYQNWGDY